MDRPLVGEGASATAGLGLKKARSVLVPLNVAPDAIISIPRSRGLFRGGGIRLRAAVILAAVARPYLLSVLRHFRQLIPAPWHEDLSRLGEESGRVWRDVLIKVPILLRLTPSGWQPLHVSRRDNNNSIAPDPFGRCPEKYEAPFAPIDVAPIKMFPLPCPQDLPAFSFLTLSHWGPIPGAVSLASELKRESAESRQSGKRHVRAAQDCSLDMGGPTKRMGGMGQTAEASAEVCKFGLRQETPLTQAV